MFERAMVSVFTSVRRKLRPPRRSVCLTLEVQRPASGDVDKIERSFLLIRHSSVTSGSARYSVSMQQWACQVLARQGYDIGLDGER